MKIKLGSVVRNRSSRLSEAELRVALDQIVNLMYLDGVDTLWSPETVEQIAEILKDNNVVEIIE